MACLRRGDERAFEELFERYSEGILSFCSSILASRDEGEDALQHVFLAVWQAVVVRGVEPRTLSPWLYTIARNRCMSVLRSCRETALGWEDQNENLAAREQTAERVERRADVRELLSDVQELPEPQRAALLLSELGELSHVEIASILGCRRAKVKSLVFQARSSLIRRSEARESSCIEVREELAGSPQSRLPLVLRRHLKGCEGCSEFETAVGRQRRLLAAALPVAAPSGLKHSVLAAVGGGSGAGAGAGGGGLMAGLAATCGGSAGVGSGAIAGAALAANAGLAKAASVGVALVTLAGAGVAIDKPARDRGGGGRAAQSQGRPSAQQKRTVGAYPLVRYDNPARAGQPRESPGPELSPAAGGSPKSKSPSSEPASRKSEGQPAGNRGPGRAAKARPQGPQQEKRIRNPRAGGLARERGTRPRPPYLRAGGRSGSLPNDLARALAKAQASGKMSECFAIFKADRRRALLCAALLNAERSERPGPPLEKPPNRPARGPRSHERRGLP